MIALVRGGGDLASGVALRLQRAGCRVAITELPQPLVVRRYVSFAEAVFRGRFTVEGVVAQRAADAEEARAVMARGETGGLLALAYSTMRGYGDTHPTIAELRVGYLPIRLPHPVTGEPQEIGAQRAADQGGDPLGAQFLQPLGGLQVRQIQFPAPLHRGGVVRENLHPGAPVQHRRHPAAHDR
jgi:hypothetical protein